MDVKINHVLCSIDFSQFTTPVLQTGIHLATRFRASLIVFHAVYEPRDALYNDRGPERDQNQRRQVSRAKNKIEELMSSCLFPWEAMVTIGEPVEALKRISVKISNALVVAASYGLSGFKRMFLGTVVERMVRILPCPMLIIRPTETDCIDFQEYRKVLVACDMDTDPDPVVPMALTMAAEKNTEFYLFHANASPMNAKVVDPTKAPYQKIQQNLQASQAQKLLADIPAWARDRYHFKTILRAGRPDEALTEYMAENLPDLIVIGVKKSRLKRLLIGSTTEKILRRAACTILTVPLPATAKSR